MIESYCSHLDGCVIRERSPVSWWSLVFPPPPKGWWRPNRVQLIIHVAVIDDDRVHNGETCDLPKNWIAV